jgi:hypothetical protein
VAVLEEDFDLRHHAAAEDAGGEGVEGELLLNPFSFRETRRERNLSSRARERAPLPGRHESRQNPVSFSVRVSNGNPLGPHLGTRARAEVAPELGIPVTPSSSTSSGQADSRGPRLRCTTLGQNGSQIELQTGPLRKSEHLRIDGERLHGLCGVHAADHRGHGHRRLRRRQQPAVHYRDQPGGRELHEPGQRLIPRSGHGGPCQRRACSSLHREGVPPASRRGVALPLFWRPRKPGETLQPAPPGGGGALDRGARRSGFELSSRALKRSAAADGSKPWPSKASRSSRPLHARRPNLALSVDPMLHISRASLD